MAQSKIETGHVVQLSSGGPEMTVAGIVGDEKNPLSKELTYQLKFIKGAEDGDIYCQWFSDGKLESAVFKPSMLL